MKEKFSVTGMSCAACVAHVSKAVKGVEGVSSVNVNLLTNSMEVEFNNTSCIKEINKAVSRAGYKSMVYVSGDDTDKSFKLVLIRLILSLILLVPLFYLSMGHMMGWNIGFFKNHLIALGWVLCVLALLMMVINNKFFISGTKSLIHGAPSMDTLVALGSGVAFIYSCIILALMIFGNDTMRYSMNLSFETAGMVPTLITIGKLLEAYSKDKTTNALKSLINLKPKSANVIRDGIEIQIDPSEMAIGDIFVVRPGEAYPVDGRIIDGMTSANEASLTGESLPVAKNTGDNVYQATINIDGTVKCMASSVGDDTTLSKIIKMVSDAGASKAPISRIADRVAGVFVPIIMCISIVVFVVWMIFGGTFVSSHTKDMLVTYSLERAISVLVIACPCALGLATPVAIMVGNGRAAKEGILYKNASVLERCGKADFVFLDKTGTITTGDMSVSNVYEYDKDLLKMASSLEVKSSHPISKAIISYYTGDILEVDEFKNIPGIGVCARYCGKELYGVSRNEALKHVELPNEDIKPGETATYFIYDGKLLGIICVSDTIKEDSFLAVKEFKELGITPIMLTGDSMVCADDISKRVSIDYVMAEMMPSDKLKAIEKMKMNGTVLMIGDGINDSPALTKADIGIAIGAGSDVAIDCAEIVLVKSSLRDAAAAIRMSRRTKLNICENLFWAFFYNIVMIPIAAGAFSFAGLYKMKPWYGSLAMALSSLCVVLNALRLNLYNPYKQTKARKEKNLDIYEILKGGEEMDKVVINVDGMMCNHCKANVEKTCKAIAGVLTAEVSLEDKNVTLTGDFNADDVKKAITEAGYTVL